MSEANIEKWKLITASGKEVEVSADYVDAHFAGRFEDGMRLVNFATGEDAWLLKDKRGVVVAVSRKEPTTARFLSLMLAEMWRQTDLLEGIKKAIDEEPSEIYLDDLLKGQESTNKQLGELVQAAERIANNTADKE